MKKLLLIILLTACNQKPNPPIEWPPMPGYELSPVSSADAGAQ